jgi:ppGpp synthetase/RelA/SpoT-type nucleotidyltranferase
VSQRLKRLPTILDKLVRQPNMALAVMQDIGGCRAILSNVEEVRRVQRRLVRNRPPRKVDDYIANPRASGYRGVHVIVVYDDRFIEVQLRTRVMHQWAVAVERLGGRIGEDLKSSQGPPQVLTLLEAISEAMAVEESGGVVQNELMERIDGMRQVAQPFLRGGSS